MRYVHEHCSFGKLRSLPNTCFISTIPVAKTADGNHAKMLSARAWSLLAQSICRMSKMHAFDTTPSQLTREPTSLRNTLGCCAYDSLKVSDIAIDVCGKIQSLLLYLLGPGHPLGLRLHSHFCFRSCPWMHCCLCNTFTVPCGTYYNSCSLAQIWNCSAIGCKEATKNKHATPCEEKHILQFSPPQEATETYLPCVLHMLILLDRNLATTSARFHPCKHMGLSYSICACV